MQQFHLLEEYSQYIASHIHSFLKEGVLHAFFEMKNVGFAYNVACVGTSMKPDRKINVRGVDKII